MKRKLFVVGLGLLLLAAAAAVFYVTQSSHHSAPAGPPAAIEPTGEPARDAIRKAIAYLRTRQEPDGEFSAGLIDPKPAYTALVVDGLARSPEIDALRGEAFFQRAVAAIVKHRQPDGGIYTPRLGLDGYCTAISIMALKNVGDPALGPVIEDAKKYLAGCQVDVQGNYRGGFGYSKGQDKADLSNTAMAVEALREAGISKDDPIFQRVQGFLDSVHNDGESNKAPWATNDGGFIYRPGESKAGSYKDEQGVERFRSYGLMSYAGLLSFLTAHVDKRDPRVRSSWRWVQANWDLESNRNLGPRGLFYYYLTMAKALEAYGERHVTTADGVKHDWPVELAKAIVARQEPDGCWRNHDKTWHENDEVLVTAYMLRALAICRQAQATLSIPR